jgi:hypothetical protein
MYDDRYMCTRVAYVCDAGCSFSGDKDNRSMTLMTYIQGQECVGFSFGDTYEILRRFNKKSNFTFLSL